MSGDEPIDRKELNEALGTLGKRFDREKILDYLEEFLGEARGKPPAWVMPGLEAACVAYVILEDTALEEPNFTGSALLGNRDLGVPLEIAEIFTWGLFL